MQINTTTVELLFILVFISQIILLSWYFPKTIIDRINRGDYTLEELTITEQEELKRFLKKETVLGK
jgi:hypothetical protein